MFKPCPYRLHHQTLAQDKADLSKKKLIQAMIKFSFNNSSFLTCLYERFAKKFCALTFVKL